MPASFAGSFPCLRMPLISVSCLVDRRSHPPLGGCDWKLETRGRSEISLKKTTEKSPLFQGFKKRKPPSFLGKSVDCYCGIAGSEV